MTPISAQGSVPITGGIMYTPPTGMAAEVTNIKLNVPSGSYTVTVKRYTAELSTLVTLYSFALSAGNVVDDCTVYQLQQGDYLYLIPSVATVKFVITGLEYPVL